jgi:hypothetical protein
MATRSSESAARPPAWPDADHQRRAVGHHQRLQVLRCGAESGRQLGRHHAVAGDAPPMQSLNGQPAWVQGLATERIEAGHQHTGGARSDRGRCGYHRANVSQRGCVRSAGMKWEGNRESDNVEDRRDGGGGGGGGGLGGLVGGRGIGIGTIVIALIGGWAFGINPLTDSGPAQRGRCASCAGAADAGAQTAGR